MWRRNGHGDAIQQYAQNGTFSFVALNIYRCLLSLVSTMHGFGDIRGLPKMHDFAHSFATFVHRVYRYDIYYDAPESNVPCQTIILCI